MIKNPPHNGQAILVTGCNGGIGSAICRHLAMNGFFVIGTDNHGQPLPGLTMAYIDWDLTALSSEGNNPEKLGLLVQSLLYQHCVKLHGLVNNAAYQYTSPLDELPLEQFERSQQINVTAPFILSKLFAPALRESRGCIVNIGSIHGRLTKPCFLAYSTSKAAMSGLTRALAIEFQGQVKVNAILPAAIRTSMLEAGFAQHPEQLAQLADHHPSRRIGEPDEVAALVTFLCSDQAPFINGAELSIDGGIGGRLHDPE